MNNYILKIEHMPFHSSYGVADEMKTPEIVVERIPITNNDIINLGDVKLEVLLVTDNYVKLLLPYNKDICYDYEMHQNEKDEIITLFVDNKKRLKRIILENVEYWDITYINEKAFRKENDNKSIISLEIVSDNNTYKIQAELKKEKSCVTYTDSNNNIHYADLNELMFKELDNKFNKITSNWKNNYFKEANTNVRWNLKKIEKGKCIKEYNGENAYPDNWNEFIDCIVFYEKVCKINSMKKMNINGIDVPYKKDNNIILADPNQLYKAAIESSVRKYLTINSSNNEIINNVKNLYRIILVCGEYENPILDEKNLKEFLVDKDKVIELVKKFKDINKNKFNNELTYLTFDINDYSLLNKLIDILKDSFKVG